MGVLNHLPPPPHTHFGSSAYEVNLIWCTPITSRPLWLPWTNDALYLLTIAADWKLKGSIVLECVYCTYCLRRQIPVVSMYIDSVSPGAVSNASPSHSQDGSTALILAANGGSVELVRMLLDEFGSTVDEVNNVSILHVCTLHYQVQCLYSQKV